MSLKGGILAIITLVILYVILLRPKGTDSIIKPVVYGGLFTLMLYQILMMTWSRKRKTPSSVIILGGTKGLGAALALEFQKRFPTRPIFCVARHLPNELIGSIRYVTGDVIEASQWDLDAMFPDTDDAWVINCAGMARCSLFCDIEDIALATKQMIDINLSGTIHSAWAFLRGSNRKYIIVSSVVAHIAVPGFTVYRAGKYALRGFYESLCAEGLSDRVGIVYANTMLTEGYVEEEAAGKPDVTKLLESWDNPAMPREAASHIINHMLTHGPHGVMMTSKNLMNGFFCSSIIDIIPIIGWWKRCAVAAAEWIVFPWLTAWFKS